MTRPPTSSCESSCDSCCGARDVSVDDRVRLRDSAFDRGQRAVAQRRHLAELQPVDAAEHPGQSQRGFHSAQQAIDERQLGTLVGRTRRDRPGTPASHRRRRDRGRGSASAAPRRKRRRTRFTAICPSQPRTAPGSRSVPSCSNAVTNVSWTISSASPRLASSRTVMASRLPAWRRYSISRPHRSPASARRTSSSSPSASDALSGKDRVTRTPILVVMIPGPAKTAHVRIG